MHINSLTAEQAARKILEWRHNPVQFVRDCFNVEPDAWQIQVLEMFGDQNEKKRRISMQACVGPGKSAVLAWCALNFLVCYADIGHHPKGAVVAVTHDNLKDNLWPEISKWMQTNSQSKYPFISKHFEWTKERIFCKEHPETWFLSARSYSKSANADEQGRTLSGLHSKYVLAMVDESGEVPVAVAKAAEQAMSEVHCSFARILQAGNPTSHSGMLYAAANELSDLWEVVRITGDPDDPKRSPRIDIDWARTQIETYGRDNPWVMSSILGLFPPSSLNNLISLDIIQKAMSMHYTEPQYAHAQKRLGVDVARFGDDRTCIFPRQGLVAFKPFEMRNASSHEIAARVMSAKYKWKSEAEFVDGTGGYGSGVVDSIKQSGENPYEIHFSSKATDSRYLNKRAEMWFRMKDWLESGGALPNIPGLAKELAAPMYYFQNGKFQLEPKEQIKKRLGFSPDIADALALTFAIEERPSNLTLNKFLPNLEEVRHVSDYDPFRSSG